MLTTQRLVLAFVWLLVIANVCAQTLEGQKKSYPIGMDGKDRVVSGFVSSAAMTDDDAFAKTLLWVIQNVCPAGREGISEVDVAEKSFICDLVLSSSSEKPEVYYCKARFQVAEGKLVYYLSQIRIESTVVVMKKITPMEKLQPEKKEAHRQMMDNFVKAESKMLNELFGFVAVNPIEPVTHWNEIDNETPVKGMSETECLLAFGKPQSISESNGEVQWMYSGSFYLFFKEGKVVTIIK